MLNFTIIQASTFVHKWHLSVIYERAVLVLVLIALHLAHLDCIENTDAIIFSKKDDLSINLLLMISSMLKSQL